MVAVRSLTIVMLLAAVIVVGSGAPAAAAASPVPDVDPMAASEFTGTYTFHGDQMIAPQIAFEEGVDRFRGGEAWAGIAATSTDPRFGGRVGVMFDRDVYRPQMIGVSWGTWTVADAAGSWSGPWAGPIRPADGLIWPSVQLLSGTGAYEGMSAMVIMLDVDEPECRFEGRCRFEGVIVPGSLPALAPPGE